MKTAIALLVLSIFAAGAAHAEPAHGIAMIGTPRYGPDFRHFDYVNPDAPRGGELRLAVVGSFNTLNPFNIKGDPADGLRGAVFESLMERALDEPFTLYGLIAESVDTPPDRSSVTFRLRQEARFSDGKPVTAADVLFSWQLLRDHGRPNFQTYYKKVARAEASDDHTVVFTFQSGADREIPLIMALMPILPKHVTDPARFEETTLATPVGSGPYAVSAVDTGRSISLRRRSDYWGRDLPVMRGRYNFDLVRYDYFRDATSAFEAFKAGTVSLRSESDPSKWAIAYDFPAVTEGRILRQEFEIGLPAGMSALVFNTRRPVFTDPRVRKALTLLFDFEWINKTLFAGLYTRTQSFFERSALSSHGMPADARERRLLASFAGEVDPDILEGRWSAPRSAGDGHNRHNLRAAFALLKDAGYALEGGRMVKADSKAPLTFEILAQTREQERLLLSFTSALKRAGIEAQIRHVDSALYQQRLNTFDYDMLQFTWPASLSPGNEQTYRWGIAAADAKGSFNLAGVKSKAAEAMIAAMLSSGTEEELVSATRALDRVLLSGDYVIPLYHLKKQWVAYWKGLHFPTRTSLYGYQLDTWWKE